MAQLIASVLGHYKIKDSIFRAIDSGLESGCFLFLGPEGVGKQLLAIAVAQYYLCERQSGCGVCSHCLRVEKKNHEGLLIVDSESQMIKMEEAERVKSFLSLKSISNKRFIIIDNAHLMNTSTSNSLLKTFEEPPQDVFFILISHQSKGLLRTIRSRSRIFRFAQLDQESTQRVSEKLNFSNHNFLSRGQFHYFKNKTDIEVNEEMKKSISLLEKLIFGESFWTDNTWKQSLKDKIQFSEALNLTQFLVRDALVFQNQNQNQNSNFVHNNIESEIVLSEYSDLSKRMAQKEAEWLFSLFDQIQEVKNEILWSPDPVLSIEKLRYELEKV